MSDHRIRRSAERILTVTTVVVLVLADTLALNQLTTQSAIDGIIQLTVVGVGVTGVVQVLALLIGPRGGPWRWLGLPIAALAALALFGWRAEWPIGWAVLACAGSAAVWAIAGTRSLALADTDPTASRASALVTIVQAGIYGAFAVVVAIDARHVLLG
jgi:drug/metabolite transporter (DMT)-like permease